MNWQDIPLFIINRNRLTAMCTLIDWLLAAGLRKIVIVDNQSDYPPLLRYYEALPAGVKVLLMDQNHGPYVLWQQGVHKELDTPYIVTDSDLVPPDFCPSDLVPALLRALERFPDAGKVGPGLRIDNLPDGYREAGLVRQWESQFWELPLGGGCFAAPIDTTFALYPPRAEFSRDDRNIRLGYPYLLEHTPWYAEEARLNEEEVYYRAHTSPVFSHWSVDQKDSRVAKSERIAGYAQRPRILHLGGGHEHVFSWINADAGGRLLDLRFDATRCTPGSLDLQDNSVDGFYMGPAFTWVEQPLALMDELYRVARPGARLVLRLPHGGSDEAISHPLSCKRYVESSFQYFAQNAQVLGPSSYLADWQVERCDLQVSPELAAQGPDAALATVQAGRNQVRDMLVTLSAVKPARSRSAGQPAAPRVSVSGQPRLVPRFGPPAA